MVKNKDVMDNIMDVKERVSRIEQHLKAQNNKIFKNEKGVKGNKDDINNLEKRFAKWAGAFAAAILIIEILIKSGVLLGK